MGPRRMEVSHTNEPSATSSAAVEGYQQPNQTQNPCKVHMDDLNQVHHFYK